MHYTLDENWIIIKDIYEKNIPEFLEKYIPSKKMRHLLIQNKWIWIEDRPATREDSLEQKKVRIRLYDEKIVSKPNVTLNIEVIYEDPFLIVVNKPAGISVHSNGNDILTLQECVNYYFWKNAKYGTPLPIHRLDKDTTGLVMFSKSPVFQPLFDSLVSEKKIERQYLAFVKAKILSKTSFRFSESIGNNRYDSSKRIISKNGKHAVTEVYSLGSNGRISVLKCKLQTGRTHQIRVHLSYHKFPIINDSLYGVKSQELTCMGLVGNRLCFFHPLLDRVIDLHLNLDPEFEELLVQCTQ